MTTRRKFLTTGALGGAAPRSPRPVVRAQSTIRWRLQTYAGASLGAQVAKPAIDMFNAIAGDEMQIDLFYADQLVPTDELFQAMQRGTIDAVQSDDDSAWPRPPRSPSSAATSPSPAAIRSTCRRCSTTGG
jgi:TRAP-type mannitol/chloroaromatic compound transport system substrate-binding protein